MAYPYTLTVNDNVVTLTLSGALTCNREYLVTIDPYISGIIPPSGSVGVLASTYSFWFTSTYCPLFTTLGRIKLLVGPDADQLLDDTIYRMIHKNSLDAVELYNLSTTQNIAYDYWGCDWQKVPLKLKRYVECKTAYDVLSLLKNIGAGGAGANQLKTLGDMTIKYAGNTQGTNPDLNSPNRMKEMYDCWHEMLRAFRNINVAVRGYYDKSKGYAHPVVEGQHNRVVRPVVWNRGVNQPNGPWVKGYPWQRFDT